LITSDDKIGKAGTSGTLRNALADIYSQGKFLVVVVRTEEGADRAEAESNIIGTIKDDESRTGIQAFIHAKAITGLCPKILAAPEYSQTLTVGVTLESVASKLCALPIIEGSASNFATVVSERQNYSKAYFVDPGIAFGNETRGASAIVAGHIAKVDHKLGYWKSPSNKRIQSITGTSKPVDHNLGDKDSLSNRYSFNKITTIIRQDDGHYLWGNKLADGTLITHYRIEIMVAEAMMYAHQKYLDENIEIDYVDSIVTRVNNFLRALVKRKVIVSGEVWFDPKLNDDAALANLNVFFNYRIGMYSLAERITFFGEARLASSGEVFNQAA
jgi:phage tail sheath protein FI